MSDRILDHLRPCTFCRYWGVGTEYITWCKQHESPYRPLSKDVHLFGSKVMSGTLNPTKP